MAESGLSKKWMFSDKIGADVCVTHVEQGPFLEYSSQHHNIFGMRISAAGLNDHGPPTDVWVGSGHVWETQEAVSVSEIHTVDVQA